MTLSTRQREVRDQFALGPRTYAEVATALGISAERVRQLVVRLEQKGAVRRNGGWRSVEAL